MNQIQQAPLLVNNFFFVIKEKRTLEMTRRINNTSYNTKKNTKITKKPTQIGRRAWEGR